MRTSCCRCNKYSCTHCDKRNEPKGMGMGTDGWMDGYIYLYLANFQRLLTKLSTKCNAKRNKIVQDVLMSMEGQKQKGPALKGGARS